MWTFLLLYSFHLWQITIIFMLIFPGEHTCLFAKSNCSNIIKLSYRWMEMLICFFVDWSILMWLFCQVSWHIIYTLSTMHTPQRSTCPDSLMGSLTGDNILCEHVLAHDWCGKKWVCSWKAHVKRTIWSLTRSQSGQPGLRNIKAFENELAQDENARDGNIKRIQILR